MNTINTYQVKSQLSKLIKKVQDGSEVVIANAGKPVAILTAYKAKPQSRVPGTLRGKVTIAKDFDELPDTVLTYFS